MYCIFCGSPARGEVTIQCDRCGRTHYLNSKIGSSTLTVERERYLVVQSASAPELGKWDLPGGFVEHGEDPAAAAARETLEETGMHVMVDRLLGVWMDEYLEPDGRAWPTMNLVYAAKLRGGSGDAVRPRGFRFDRHEIADCRWVPLVSPPADIAFPIQQLGALEAYAARGPV